MNEMIILIAPRSESRAMFDVWACSGATHVQDSALWMRFMVRHHCHTEPQILHGIHIRVVQEKICVPLLM